MIRANRVLRAAAVGVALALGAAGCTSAPTGEAPAPSPTETTAEPTEACAVSGPGGFADAGLGEQMLAALTTARDEGRIGGTQTLRMATRDDARAALQSMTRSGCSVVSAPAGAAAEVRSLADSRADLPFVLIGGGADDLPSNVATLGFDQRGPAYLAGYTAAAFSESGTVATFGGVRDRGTVRAMDAFAAGVERYNEDQREASEGEPTPTASPAGEDESPRTVRLVGWDRGQRTGTFAREVGDAREATRAAVDEGADVVFPVAGDANAGVVEAIEAVAEDEEDAALADVRLVWPGADGRAELPDTVSGNVLASIVWQVDVGYEAVLSEWSTGTERTPVRLTSRSWTGDLANEGVTFVEPGETELLTAVGLEGRLDELRTALLEGEIDLG